MSRVTQQPLPKDIEQLLIHFLKVFELAAKEIIVDGDPHICSHIEGEKYGGSYTVITLESETRGGRPRVIMDATKCLSNGDKIQQFTFKLLR